mgnify:FL=1
MAKIQEEIIVIKLSKLIKNSTDGVAQLVNEDFTTNLEVIVGELVGNDVVVEVEKA